MRKIALPSAAFLMIYSVLATVALADQRQAIYGLGLELERQASVLAQESFDHFRGRNNTISDEEQAVLFNSEAFLASCRLFLRLTEERSDYYSASFLRTNLYNAFLYLARSFRELEGSMKTAGVLPYALADCRRSLNRMEGEFSRWQSPDNLAYLDQRYVKAGNATVYLIERKGTGSFVRRAFKNLESLYRYNYDRSGGKNPWAHLVDVAEVTLDKIEEGEIIDLTFEGRLIIEQSTRPNRSVYLVEDGKKRGVTSPRVLERLGGWSRVFEVPAEVISGYPDGEPIT